MENVASYKAQTVLDTNKRVNLVYGLNGTGKSTISDFLYNQKNGCYRNCSIEGLVDEDILVYNQQFVKDYFYTPDGLKGVFTLSRENKAVEERIKSATNTVLQLENSNKLVKDSKLLLENEILSLKQTAENAIWEIKSKYSGGDRVLDFCLEGLMGRKESLFNHISAVKKTEERPVYNIGELKREAELIQDNSIHTLVLLPKIDNSFLSMETNELFKKEIIGNKNSTVAELITKLGNSDWVKQGLEFLPIDTSDSGEKCPFCQEKTITNILIEKINSYFDKAYEDSLSEIQKIDTDYHTEIVKIPTYDKYSSNLFVINSKEEFEKLYKALSDILSSNENKIKEKLKTPSQQVQITSSDYAISAFNTYIDNINIQIVEYNKKIENRTTSLRTIKTKFWNLMRWEYDQTISQYVINKSEVDKKILIENKKVIDYTAKISEQKKLISIEQKNTVNIEDAINNINSGLIELGIDGFYISKHMDNLYKIVRKEPCHNTFETLSEGEKMIISFLYFRELCKGLKAAESQLRKKVIVIDDPISSLSHIYIFNIGQI